MFGGEDDSSSSWRTGSSSKAPRPNQDSNANDGETPTGNTASMESACTEHSFLLFTVDAFQLLTTAGVSARGIDQHPSPITQSRRHIKRLF